MDLKSGDKLGPYEILSRLGVGGMGEVWKARDPRLDRIVAIKTSHAKFSERFDREARAVAALNHPNICQLYDVGPDYLVMEYIDGSPVTTPDSPRKLLDIAVQMSEGLAAAHAAGIVHRDLKPDNILIAREGKIKILDFGLAKAVPEEVSAEEATRTVAVNLTDPGTTVGTIAYMSPEQARGQTDLTPQSDQFSLGLVLYELAAGRKAFARGSTAEIMTAIIREEAEPLPARVPAPFRWIVERLLAKEPAERYDSTRDLYRELRQVRDRLSESLSAGAVPSVSAARKRRPLPGITLIAAGLVLCLGVAALLRNPPPADFSAYRFTPVSRAEESERSPRWSPDGRSIAYLANIHGVLQVFTIALGSADKTQLTHAKEHCGPPLWSPDGATIFYVCHGDLCSVGASGGAPETVMEKVASPAIHPDGQTLVFRRDGKTWVGALKGGAPKELRIPQVPDFIPESFSPDGSQLLIQAVRNSECWLKPWPSGTPRKVDNLRSNGSWLPDSRHFLMQDWTLLDTRNGSSRVIYNSPGNVQSVAVSPDGRKIAYSGGAVEWNVVEISVPEGRVRTSVGGGGIFWQPDWAPSGTHFLFTDWGSDPAAIEDRSSADGFSRRVAEAPQGKSSYVSSARWAPDGTRFLFTQREGASPSQLMVASAAGGRRTALAELDDNTTGAYNWSPDSRWIVFQRTVGGKPQLVKMKPVAGAVAIPFAGADPSSVNRSIMQWSGAGDWIAYQSAEGISIISPDGGTVRKLTGRKLSGFAFSKDGIRSYGIFGNRTGEGAQWQLYSIDVKTGAEKMLSSIDLPASVVSIQGFSLHPDGKRFLTSVSKQPFDIWMLEGWDQPQKTWLDRLLRR